MGVVGVGVGVGGEERVLKVVCRSRKAGRWQVF
jgi:hypothetical protein